MIWPFLAFACSAEKQTSEQATNEPMVEMKPLSPVENLQSSWRADLGKPLKATAPQTDCPDADGDGFVSAIACPYNAPQTLDCDDSDPKVTPENEIWITPGLFIMGSNSDHAGADEKPVHLVDLSGYCLDKDEVNSRDWAAWMQSAGRKPMGKDVRNVDANGQLMPGKADYPAEGVSFEEARDFCVAKGKQLPTEAQWEKAARGGCELYGNKRACDSEDLQPYPWGKGTPSCDKANHNLSTSGRPKLCLSDTLKASERPNGNGPYGHRHLAGNVWEFVSDYWHPKTYTKDSIRKDPSGPKNGDIHVLRGGGWNTFSTNMRVSNRFHDLVMGSAVGFRCARPTVEPTPDAVPTLQTTTISGKIEAGNLPAISGRALYVAVFDAEDANAQCMLPPGRSPVVEEKLTPNGQKSQAFEIRVPKGMKTCVNAALDGGTGAKKDQYKSASGSGGFGMAKNNPVDTNSTTTGIKITLSKNPGPPPPQ